MQYHQSVAPIFIMWHYGTSNIA